MHLKLDSGDENGSIKPCYLSSGIHARIILSSYVCVPGVLLNARHAQAYCVSNISMQLQYCDMSRHIFKRCHTPTATCI